MPKPIPILLDTNVLFSALYKQDGSCRHLLEILVTHPEEFRICYTSHILDEYYDVLARPKLTSRVSATTSRRLITLIEQIGDETLSQPLDWLIYPDNADKPFVEAALYNDAILITCNMRDFPYTDLKVVYPDEFISWWRERA